MATVPDAVVGGGVVVIPLDHPASRVLAAALHQVRRRAHHDGQPVDTRLTALAFALDGAGIPGVPTVSGAQPAKPNLGQSGFTAPGLESGTFSASDVAGLVGITGQAVTKAARSGRLAGQRGPHGWMFTAAAVRRWRSQRRPSRLEQDDNSTRTARASATTSTEADEP